MRPSGSLLLQHSEEPEPNIKHNKNDTIISTLAKTFVRLKTLETMGCLFHVSQFSLVVRNILWQMEGMKDLTLKERSHPHPSSSHHPAVPVHSRCHHLPFTFIKALVSLWSMLGLQKDVVLEPLYLLIY